MLIFDIIIGMLLISGISMACLGLYGMRFSDRIPAAVPYTLLMFSAFAWAILYALELLAESLPLKILFHNLRFLILPFIAVLELWLVFAFVKRTEWIRKDWAAAVLIIPVAAAILGITSSLHTLFRYNFSIDSSGPVSVLHYTDSPFYLLYILYSLLLLILAIVILIVESGKRKTLWQEQTILLLIALAFPTVINYLFVFGLTPVQGVNMTAPLFWIAVILYTVALFRYRFLDIIPIARSRLIETMSTPMLVLDTGGLIIDLNPAACELFSTTSSAAVGKPVNGIVPDWPDFLMLCLSDKTSYSNLTRGREGSTRFYTGSVEQIRTSSGEPEGRLILLQDVTELKRVEEALVESESFNRGLVENLPEYVVVYGSAGKILYVNPATERALGYNAVELTGTSLLSYVAPEYRDIANAKMTTRLKGGKPPAYEVDIIAKDGLRRSVIAKGTPMIQYHDSPAILLLLIDITERKKAEETIRHSLAEKEVLLQEIHHRVKNNLAGIIALINLQTSSLTDPASIFQFKGLETRIRSMALVHESLCLTKDLARIDVATYTENLTRHLLAVYGDDPKIQFRIDMGDITMSIDTAMPCGLVMTEIVTNSLKYAFPSTFSCGEIRGEPCTISITMQREGTDYILTIADNGIGIPTGINVTMATSLGLFLIRFIMEHQLRGTLDVNTDNGTSYRIRFPEPESKERKPDE